MWENIREYKNCRNTANIIITKEHFQKKKNNFNDKKSSKQKWRLAKDEMGQNNHVSPKLIREGENINYKPHKIANSLNRLYISAVRETINLIPKTLTNPLTHYQKVMGPVDSTLEISNINMSQLKSVINTMAPTTSTTNDYI